MQITTVQEAKNLLKSGEVLVVRQEGKWERLWTYTNNTFMSKTFQPDNDHENLAWTAYTDRDFERSIEPDVTNYGIDIYESH